MSPGGNISVRSYAVDTGHFSLYDALHKLAMDIKTYIEKKKRLSGLLFDCGCFLNFYHLANVYFHSQLLDAISSLAKS